MDKGDYFNPGIQASCPDGQVNDRAEPGGFHRPRRVGFTSLAVVEALMR